MKNLLSSGLAKRVILFALIVGLVSPSAIAFTDQDGIYYQDDGLVAAIAPIVQDLHVTTNNQVANVNFSLNTEANTTIFVKDTSNQIVRTLIFDNLLQGGVGYTYPWDGLNNQGQTVASGTYKAEVAVYNTASSSTQEYFFTYTASSPATPPTVNISVNPSSFDPSKQSTTINYDVNTTANLRVQVKSGDSVVRTLRNYGSHAAGAFSIAWDGRNDSGNILSNGVYTAEVYADNAYGSGYAPATVTITSTPSVTAPNVTNLYASPTPFNPGSTSTRVYFNVDKTAAITVSILDGSTTVKTLTSGVTVNAGTYYYEWNGRNSSGDVVADRVYTARVLATNAGGSDTENTSVEVRTNSNNSCDLIGTHSVTPSTFDPADRDTQIYYNLLRASDVTIRILDGSTTIKTLVNNVNQGAAQRYVYWNGRNYDGNIVADKTYTYEIRAFSSGCSEEIVSGSVRLSRGSGNDNYVNDWASTDENLVRDLIVDPDVFNPRDGERSSIEFELSRRADLLVQVLDGTTVVKTLRRSDDQTAGDYAYTWDGRDSRGNLMPDRVYAIRVMADDGNNTDTDRAYSEVDTDGRLIGFPDGARCAGFRDVSINSPFCRAVELMSKKKIFEGYSDGTFRPYERINRAEATKVIVLSLGYSTTDVGYFGRQYNDTVVNAWYAPYLEVARRNNIATGYPDGSFRPGSTINRVELLRVFLEANNLNLSSCSPQPFVDTPAGRDTDWYMKYACYAKHNGLMNSEYSDRLYPAEAMTRGDVADLFYDFEMKGLFNRFNRDSYNYNNYNYGYDYNYNYNYNNDSRYCLEYDRYNNCVRYSSNTNSDRYSYTGGNDGYYVYRNGQYVWVAY